LKSESVPDALQYAQADVCTLLSGKIEQFASATAGTQLSLKLLQLLPLVKARLETRHCACDKRLLHLPSLHHCG
jgi:hypothetical protein